MRIVLLLSFALLAGAAPVRAGVPLWLAGELSLHTGVDFSDGSYGSGDDQAPNSGAEERTETLFVPFTLSYLFDHFLLTPYPDDLFELRATVPWISVDGPGIPELAAAGARDVESDGLGDITVGATYLIFPPSETALPALELSTRFKIPTASNADDRLLGTGRPTYTLQADLYRRMGRFTPLATVGYRITGHSRRYKLRNAAFTSVGGTVQLAVPLSVGLLYDWSQQTSRFSAATHELFPYAVVKLRDDLRLMPYGIVGLSEHAPDWGLGFQLRFTIPVR